MKLRLYKRELAAAMAYAVLLVLVAEVAPTFFSAANVRDLTINNAPTLIVAIGMTMVIQIVLAVQQHPGHETIVSQVPGPLDDITPAEGVTNVLPCGPAEREAGIQHQHDLPAQAEAARHQRRILDEALRLIEPMDQPGVRKLVVALETAVEKSRGER